VNQLLIGESMKSPISEAVNQRMLSLELHILVHKKGMEQCNIATMKNCKNATHYSWRAGAGAAPDCASPFLQ
jgi:hypothetical protein